MTTNHSSFQGHLSDACFITSCLSVIYFAQYAGIADAVFTYFYIAITFGFRFIKLRHCLSTTMLVLHAAACVSIISSFDKVLGYPDGSYYGVPAFFAATAVVIFAVFHSYSSKSWIPLLAPLLIVTEAIVFPLELTKNAVARLLYDGIPAVYVTKIESKHIYGVSLYDNQKVVRFIRSGSGYQQDFETCCIQSLGSGTIDYQEARFPFLAYEMVRFMYADNRVGRERGRNASGG